MSDPLCGRLVDAWRRASKFILKDCVAISQAQLFWRSNFNGLEPQTRRIILDKIKELEGGGSLFIVPSRSSDIKPTTVRQPTLRQMWSTTASNRPSRKRRLNQGIGDSPMEKVKTRVVYEGQKEVIVILDDDEEDKPPIRIRRPAPDATSVVEVFDPPCTTMYPMCFDLDLEETVKCDVQQVPQDHDDVPQFGSPGASSGLEILEVLNISDDETETNSDNHENEAVPEIHDVVSIKQMALDLVNIVIEAAESLPLPLLNANPISTVVGSLDDDETQILEEDAERNFSEAETQLVMNFDVISSDADTNDNNCEDVEMADIKIINISSIIETDD